MVAGEQAKQVITMVRDARKTGGHFPAAIPPVADDARARFASSDGVDETGGPSPMATCPGVNIGINNTVSCETQPCR
jgi:hypothetical protein